MLGGPTSTRQCPNRIDNNEVGTASGVDGAVHLDCLPYQSFSREPARSTRVVEREEIQFAFSQEHWLQGQRSDAAASRGLVPNRAFREQTYTPDGRWCPS